MAKRYDAVVIGGGHNGLVNAAYLAQSRAQGPGARAPPHPGRRHAHRGDRSRVPVLGLLLRGVAAAARDHPRARAPEARPGDPAAGRDDHAARRRLPVACERPRHAPSASSAAGRRTTPRRTRSTAADGRDGRGSSSRSCPIAPPDPGKLDRRWSGCRSTPLAKQLQRTSPERLQTTFIQLMTMTRRRLPRPVVRDRAAEGDDERVRDHRDVPGTALSRHRATSCCTTTWARSTAPSAPGACREAGRARSAYAIASAALVAGVEIRTGGARRAHPTRRTARDRRRAASPARIVAGGRDVSSARLALDVHQAPRRPACSIRRSSAEVLPLQVPRLQRQGEPGARRPARARVQARRGRVAPRRDLASARASTTSSARTTTRSTAGPVDAPVHRHDHPDPRRPLDGAARQARHELLRPVRAVPPGRRRGVGRRRARGVRRERDRHARGAVPRHPHARSSGISSSRRRTSRTSPGLSEGNIFQGELSLEQLFFNRPVPGWSRYRTPVQDLWMCGSATHPGGGIMGAPGRISALEYLKEKRKGRRAA